MSTITKNILAIPESIVVGTGSYVIPANKYGFFQATASHGASGHSWSDTTGGSSGISYSGSGGASATSSHQYLPSGTSISVGGSAPSGTTTTTATFSGTQRSTSGAHYVNLNGSPVCYASAQAGTGGTTGSPGRVYCVTNHAGSYGWSVSLFAIPKNNLPIELTEGN